MDSFSISFTLGKGSSPHGGNIRHNNREYYSNNVEKAKSIYNIEYKRQDIEEAYHYLFDESLKEYNEKQTRKDRIIDDYYEHLQNSKRESHFYEAIVQFGNADDAPCGSSRGDVAKQMLNEYMENFQKRNPNLYVFNAVLHLDEASPHIHIDFIPFYTQGRNNGLQKGVSMKAALIEQGFSPKGTKNNQLVLWEAAERSEMERILHEHKYVRAEKQDYHRHMTVEEYKYKMAEAPIYEALRKQHFVSPEKITEENIRKLKMIAASSKERITVLEKEKSSPHKSFFYSDADKQAFIMSKMDSMDIPYVETENGFDAQECYVEQIREWEKMFKASSKSFRDKLADDIDRLLMQCSDVNELYKKLEAEGYKIKFGKYVSVKPPKAERFIRLKTLGEEYNERALQNRIQNSIKFENELSAKINQAKTENLPTYKTLSTIRFYTVTFKKGLLPCHKKFKQQPFSWTNDEELDKLLLLNKKINQGATIESMKVDFEKSEKKLQEKNAELDESKKKVKRISEGREAFEVLYENKESSTITKEQAALYQKRYPNINANNYHLTKEMADQAEREFEEIKREVKELEKEIRDLGGAISIAEQVKAGTYVQELVSKENIHRNADILPNGVFKL